MLEDDPTGIPETFQGGLTVEGLSGPSLHSRTYFSGIRYDGDGKTKSSEDVEDEEEGSSADDHPPDRLLPLSWISVLPLDRDHHGGS